MSEEEKIETEQQFGAEDYLKNLEALRNNTVSKEEYQKVLDDNRRLVDALTTGNFGTEEEPKKEYDVEGLRRSLFSPDSQHKTNLQYFTEVLDLRDALIEAGEGDIFLPFNKDYIPTDQDIKDSERIASQLRECIEYADGDPRVFNVELQRRCGSKK